MQLGNGRWESTQFNSRLQPTQIALGSVQNAADKLKLEFSYNTPNQADNNGNVLSQKITVLTVGAEAGFTATQVYSYDSLNRIKQASEALPGQTDSSWQQSFVYDRYGNRKFDESNTTTLPKHCGTAPNLTVCSSDNPLASTSDKKFSAADGFHYDIAGNTTKDPQNRKFTYDGENKQVKVETLDANNNPIATLGEYFYDGDGKRVKKFVPSTGETTVFVYDASGKTVAEYSTIVETTNAKVSYLTSDHLGSPRITTDADGKVVSRRDFHPFGEEIATPERNTALGYTGDTIRQKFTSYQRDGETDLDFAQARYYSKNLGRFYSVDPENAGARENDPQSWNGYAYGRNNPVLFTDPDGLEYRVCNNEGKCWTHDDDQIRKAKAAGGFDWEGSRSEKTGLDSGILYDSEGNQIGTYQQTSHDSAIQRMLWGAKPTLDIWQPVIEAIQPTPVPGGAVVGGIVKVGKAGKAANNVRRAILGFRIVERAGDVILVAVKTAKGEVEVMAHVVKEGGRLVLKKLHVQGSGANSLGVRELRRLEREFAQEIGKREGVKEVVVEGARRESGANPGKIPRPRTYKID